MATIAKPAGTLRLLHHSVIKMRCPNGQLIFMAGPAGIEPALKVLETLVLPLYDGPKLGHCSQSPRLSQEQD